MADTNVLKAFRARLKANGYTNIVFERLYFDGGSDGLKYLVYVTEPLPSRQRLHFIATEAELNDLLRRAKRAVK